MEHVMNSFRMIALLAVCLGAACFAGCNKPAEEPTAGTGVPGTYEAAMADSLATEQQRFADANAGSEAFVAALREADRDALSKIFGRDINEVIPEDEVDRADVEKFLAAYDESHRLITNTPGKAVLAVGVNEWTLPIPLVEDGGQWRFDMDAGDHEMAIRRIGRNELAVIQTALAYHDAQMEYASKDRNGDGILEYAQKILSTEGQKDGLFWPGEGEDQSPLGPALDETVTAGEPYHGYRYRILTSQGPHAKGGKLNYILGERMSGGFGLIAWPAVYDDTGIMTFIMNHDGTVYEKDLGEETETAAAAIVSFDPDDSWKAVKEADTAPIPSTT
jgi:hypothetical protein